MKQFKSEYKKLAAHTDVDQCPIQTSLIKEKLQQINILSQKFPQNEEGLNWIKAEGLPHRMDVSFTRPMKNIEYEKIDDNVGHWSAYYNVQLPVIIIETLSNQPESKIFLKAVQVTQLHGAIEKVTELVGENAELSNTNQRIELKGLKLNTPEKIQNKKKCIHHIAVCAFQYCTATSPKELNLVGVSISGGFSLKSRKKSHQEKGLDTSYFKPIELTQTLQQRKCKQQPINITNDIEGLQLYFTSPNIRHKMESQVRKICSEFSSSSNGSKKSKQQTMVIEINDNNNLNNLSEEDCRKQRKCMQKILKALECAKDSKCLYTLKSESNEMNETTKFYHFETQETKESLVSVYKGICQSHSGVNDSDWYYQDNYHNDIISNNSITEDSKTSSKKRMLSTMIDVNKCRKDCRPAQQLYYVQVFYSEETQSPMQNLEIQKNSQLSHEDMQGNSEEALSQANSSAIKESQRTILEKKVDYTEKHRYSHLKNKVEQETKDISQNIIKQEEIPSVSLDCALSQPPQNLPYYTPQLQHAQLLKGRIPQSIQNMQMIEQNPLFMIREQCQQVNPLTNGALSLNPIYMQGSQAMYQQQQQLQQQQAKQHYHSNHIYFQPQGFPPQLYPSPVHAQPSSIPMIQLQQNKGYPPIQNQIVVNSQPQMIYPSIQNCDKYELENPRFFQYPCNMVQQNFSLNMPTSTKNNN